MILKSCKWHTLCDLSGVVACRQDAYVGSWRKVDLLALAFTLTLTGGCSRQPAVTATQLAKSNGQQLPFDRVSDGKGISPTGELASAGIPAGTPITIRLQSALSSADSGVGDIFEAVLAGPISVHGQTVAPRGASVSGRIIASTAARQRDPGFLRLTLSSIVINGKTLPLQTSSVFAKGRVFDQEVPDTSYRSDHDAKFSTDRRLTFRVTQSVPLPD